MFPNVPGVRFGVERICATPAIGEREKPVIFRSPSMLHGILGGE